MYHHMGSLKELVEQTERKNKYTYDHGKRVMQYSLLLAEELNIDPATINVMVMAAALHDVGKCFLPDHILAEDNELTAYDRMQIIKHPLNSYRLIAGKFDERTEVWHRCITNELTDPAIFRLRQRNTFRSPHHNRGRCLTQ